MSNLEHGKISWRPNQEKRTKFCGILQKCYTAPLYFSLPTTNSPTNIIAPVQPLLPPSASVSISSRRCLAACWAQLKCFAAAEVSGCLSPSLSLLAVERGWRKGFFAWKGDLGKSQVVWSLVFWASFNWCWGSSGLGKTYRIDIRNHQRISIYFLCSELKWPRYFFYQASLSYMVKTPKGRSLKAAPDRWGPGLCTAPSQDLLEKFGRLAQKITGRLSDDGFSWVPCLGWLVLSLVGWWVGLVGWCMCILWIIWHHNVDIFILYRYYNICNCNVHMHQQILQESGNVWQIKEQVQSKSALSTQAIPLKPSRLCVLVSGVQQDSQIVSTWRRIESPKTPSPVLLKG